MKKLLTLASTLVLLSTFSTASVSITETTLDTSRGYCDIFKHFIGMCESSENILSSTK